MHTANMCEPNHGSARRWRGLVAAAAMAAGLAAGLAAWPAAADQRPAAAAPADTGVQVALRTEVSVDPLEPLPPHPTTTRSIVRQLSEHHFVKRPLDDRMSSHVFDNYLDMLDGARIYLTADDVREFEKYRYSLDEAFKQGDLEPAFTMFNRRQLRLMERLQDLVVRLAGGVGSFDFSVDEYLETDRENAAWPADRAELDDLWRKRLKATILGMRLNGKDDAEIEEVLGKRYANQLKRAKLTQSEDAFQIYVNALATAYDPHTAYLSPRGTENFNINMSLSLQGIGAVLRTDDDYTTIVRLVPAGPADKSGLIQPEDRIVGVGQGKNGKIVDVVGWRLDDVVELIRGPKDSRVRLELLRGKQEESRIVEITRDTVKLEEQSAQKRLLTIDHDGRERHIGVISVPAFYADFQAMQRGDPDFKSTTRDVARLIEELKDEGAEGLIIDLRNNGGGSLAEANSLTGLFIKSGPTVQVKNSSQRVNVYSDSDGEIAWSGPLAVMVNRLSASASEIFAGAIQDYGRGIIIGNQTFGKGTVQTLIPLNRGQLKLTQAKFYRISGKSTQHQGVVPDIEYPMLIDADEIGESALEDALPWDVIYPVRFPHSTDIEEKLTALKRKHDGRVAEDAEFAYLHALADFNRELRERSRISLNEATRRAEKASDDARRLAIENDLRKARGEPLLASLEELEALNEVAETATDNSAASPESDGPDAVPQPDAAAVASSEAATPGEDGVEGTTDNPHGDKPGATLTEGAAILLDYMDMEQPALARRN